MHIEKLDFENSPYLGVYGTATDRVALIREGLGEKKLEVLREVLKVPLIETSIMKSRIVGVFAAGNSNAIVVPWYIWDAELEHIQNELNELDIDMRIEPFQSTLTAFGNLILANDKAALISVKFTREEAKKLEDILGVEVERGMIGDYHAVGSVGVVTNRGGLVHPEATDEELEWLRDLFKVDIYVGTANMGVPFVGSCMLANSHGVVVGHLTTGPEIVKIEEALGFLD
ncbi:translation initiation factor eIF-6 [Thermococcus onnurineus NA1]|uniref:Translation initiation factor 6 n=1 Tax=Thermococcus onnurineus (strain NA1) TaxID=523850 RepID=IF6_THEON|nr:MULTISPECIES: translation initiation factor IF-6 [Thermococcus]B6YWY2.1 RecName: Full=Translation initiation factor 6; Short=aIF-6 [Thermococcus onnurineus NA1]ACJ16595.1 translation initiation factor eIF-6 [Thermococcus onnurineus NA1]NJE47440.1 translation initiation factor IF-6 [Thermococcus sp. GR7]NJE79263.1 translation initiation factor IF-6 [Thermococcus sp. GR4]NJF23490.1 translation initiation factor IF-6 [Thermococcus sp. GR5]